MDRMPKSIWHYIKPMLLPVAFGVYITFETNVLRRVAAVLGRFALFLTFWSNIVISLALRPEESVPIWIVPMLNLGALFAAMVIYGIAILVLRSCAYEGE